jgi:hypothetical protein
MAKYSFLIVMIAALLCVAHPAQASLEVLAKAEFDSNVNRGINQSKGDGIFTVQLQLEKPTTGETRLEWVYAASLQAASYVQFDELNYAEFSISPGVLYHQRITVTAALYPFIQILAVRDSAQSAVTVGAQASLSEQVSSALSLTQYYVYRQGFAKDSTYSYGMHSAGLAGALVLTSNLLADLSYEFSYGDSFRCIGPVRGNSERRGHGSRQEGHSGFSPVFGQGIIKEKVARHSLGIGSQLDLGRAWFCVFKYFYTSWRGDSGTSSSHMGSFSVGRRF